LWAVLLEERHDLHEGADAKAGTLDLCPQLSSHLETLLVLLASLDLLLALRLLSGLRLGLLWCLAWHGRCLLLNYGTVSVGRS
jgi:hypothetical protein